MNSTTDEYKKKVWAFLEGMQPGERYKVDELSETENHPKFIATIKEWMDAMPYQGNISFNKDYTAFYKMDPVPVEG